MTTVRELLQGPTYNVRQTKNFIQENMKRIKELKSSKAATPVTGGLRVESAKARAPTRPGGGSKPAARPPTEDRLQPSTLQMTSDDDQAQAAESSLPKAFRHQGVQTLDAAKTDALFEGVIRYPRHARPSDHQDAESRDRREVGLQTFDLGDGDCTRASTAHSPTRPVTDFVKYNTTRLYKERVAGKKSDPTKAPPHYQRGVLPKYLRPKKEEKEDKGQGKGDERSSSALHEGAAVEPGCMPGYVLVPEEDRQQHLGLLRTNYVSLINELNSLPVKSDSLKSRQRRREIERNLDKVEQAIKLFSREKLYVKTADP